MPLAKTVQRPEIWSARPIGMVTCPNCRVAMERVQLKRLDGQKLHPAIFRCPECHAKTRRFIIP
jgi:rubredoxin